MALTIYKDDTANAIFVEDANGVQFLNSLQATVENGHCFITDLSKNIQIVSGFAFDQFLDQNQNTYGADATEVCNALNAIFSSSGTPTGNVPVITSSLAISLTEGETLNYELTANFGVAYEWDFSNVLGVTTVEGNSRKIIGGSGLAVGTYNIPVKAINYNGEDSETIVLTVSTPPFSNTKSVQFNNQDYLGGNAALLEADLGRSGNGSGASDAWSIAFWFKGGTSTSNGQTILYFGDNDTTNGGHFYLRYRGGAGNKTIRFRYGSGNNYLNWDGAADLVPSGTWKHVIVTYDGGTTGASSGNINDYYSRFTIYVDGVDVTSGGTWSHPNYGWSSGIDADNFRVGRYASGNYMQSSCKVDELAVWDSNQDSNASSIYNSGTPFDFSTLVTQPKHWWRMGDGDTYPNLQDNGTEANCVFVMYNMTSADIVSDVP